MTITNNLFKGGLQLVNEAGVKVGGSNLVPVALRLEKTALDPAHKERSNAKLVLSNATDSAALSGKIELVQPSAYAALLKPIRFAGVAYGDSTAIDLPYLAAASLKFKVTLDDGRTYLSSVKLAQTFGGSMTGDTSDAPRIDLSAQDEYAGGGRSGAADLSADAGVAWDDEKLYFDIIVRDDVHKQSYGGGDIWQGDSIQLGIDLNRGAGAASKQVSELGFALRDDGSVVKWRWKAPDGLQTGALGADVEATVTRDAEAGATRYAIAMPLDQLHGAGFDFDPQAALGFTLLLNENDGSGREGYMEYNQGIGASKDFTLFGDLYLLDGRLQRMVAAFGPGGRERGKGEEGRNVDRRGARLRGAAAGGRGSDGARRGAGCIGGGGRAAYADTDAYASARDKWTDRIADTDAGSRDGHAHAGGNA
ncbi:sugar-binding protein [Cohnella rhizosphaerae]|uniref:Carbohydrate-binding domain-containing protein n=1 Tax=Cohnella rhizosphaerae TaxID=1457232 RepID=A0A9X4KNS3_9BACL|nr:sugar-binding protein [Cohnella rhizosphaerae]MDG0807992.1 hypothetical protein [Cohnella rhizosphaerae]